jgi:hypothetical protein
MGRRHSSKDTHFGHRCQCPQKLCKASFCLGGAVEPHLSMRSDWDLPSSSRSRYRSAALRRVSAFSASTPYAPSSAAARCITDPCPSPTALPIPPIVSPSAPSPPELAIPSPARLLRPHLSSTMPFRPSELRIPPALHSLPPLSTELRSVPLRALASFATI